MLELPITFLFRQSFKYNIIVILLFQVVEFINNIHLL